MAHKASRAARAREESRALEDSRERRVNLERLGWMVSTGRMETRGCPVLLERRGAPDGGVTKDLKETKGSEEMLASEVTRVTRDRTASRGDPEERWVTSVPWVSLGLMACQEVPENLGRMVALAEGDLQELRATRVILASQASQESRAPEAHRAPRARLVLQA